MDVLITAAFLWSVGEQIGAFPSESGHEQRLFQDLTAEYHVMSRPIRNASMPVSVKFGAALNQILDLDGKHQILSTYIWIYEQWTDENISWEPEDYNGMDRIMFPSMNIWVPDIYIFNVAGSALDGYINVTRSNVVVSHDGTVQWSIPLQIKTACPVDATYFPYDKQTCHIQFGSWIHDTSQLALELSQAYLDLSKYSLNSEFDLLNSNLEKITMNGSCCPGSGDRHMVRIGLEIRRKTLYYDYIVIAPTIDLCVLTLATFLLPCECGWKIAIGLTVFLTLYVLQLLIAENVPDTNSTPLISVFLLLVMSLNCISLITATMVMNIKRRAQHDPIPQVSPWLLYICENYLSKITCTTLLDWKRMAELPDESAVVAGLEDHRLSEIAEEDEYLQLKELTPTEPNPSSNSGATIVRTKTAESTFSCSSGTDHTDTTQLLQSRPQESIVKTIPSIPTINLSYDPDDETVTENYNKDTELTAGDDLKPNAIKPSFLDVEQSAQQVRKRPSYRKAIHGGLDTNRERTRDKHKASVKRKSIFSGKNVKYQWYFVADVIDTTAFIVYVIVMFFGILGVLVIVPLFA